MEYEILIWSARASAFFFVVAIINSVAMRLQKNTGKKKLFIFLIRHHRMFGILAGVFGLVHGVSAFFMEWIKPTGIVAMSLMLVTILIGIYKFYINKRAKTYWPHVIASVCSLGAMVVHYMD